MFYCRIILCLCVASSIQCAITSSAVLAQEKPEDPNSDVEEERKLWSKLVELELAGLKDETDKWPITSTFLSQLEAHYAAYVELESSITKEWKTPDGLKPKNPEFIGLMLKSEAFTKWCAEQKLTSDDWIRRIARIRGMIGAKGHRQSYDEAALPIRLEVLTNGPDLGISPEVLRELVRQVEVSLLISPDIIKILDKHEPKWGADELAIRDAYYAELKSFLFNPKANPFKKDDIDRRRADEAKKKEGADPDKPPEDSGKSVKPDNSK